MSLHGKHIGVSVFLNSFGLISCSVSIFLHFSTFFYITHSVFAGTIIVTKCNFTEMNIKNIKCVIRRQTFVLSQFG